MIAELTEWIIQAINRLGWVGVFLGVLIEAVIVPIPSPLVLMFAGFVLIAPGTAFFPALARILLVITLPATVAGLIGNYFVYWVAYAGGKPIIQRFHKLLGFGWGDIRRIRKKLRIAGHEVLSVAVLRAIPVMPLSLVSGAAGVVKLDWKGFGLGSLLGLLFRNTLLAFIGWRVGEVYFSIAKKMDSIETFLTLTIVGGVVLFIIAHKFRVIDRIEQWVTK